MPSPSSYWKLRTTDRCTVKDIKAYLDSVGYSFTKTLPRAKLLRLHTRAQGGLLSHQRLTLPELRTACIDRHLVAKSDTFNKAQLTDLLMDADDNLAFNRFLGLPPELRVRIYSFYFESINTRSDLLTQPPITKVSRLLRSEALPLFHSICDFVIDLGLYDPIKMRSPYIRFFQDPTPGPGSPQVPREALSRLTICGVLRHIQSLRPPEWTAIIQYEAGKHEGTMTGTVNGGAVEQRAMQRSRVRLQERLDHFVKVLAGRGARLRFVVGDVARIEQLFAPL